MFAQPGNPEPYNLSNGNYYFSSWSPNEPSGSYPPNMIFIKSSTSISPQSDTFAKILSQQLFPLCKISSITPPPRTQSLS